MRNECSRQIRQRPLHSQLNIQCKFSISQAFFRAASGEIPSESWCTHRKNRLWRVLTKKKKNCTKYHKKHVSGTSEQLGMRPRCGSPTFAPPHPKIGWVTSVWVYPGRTEDLMEWVVEVEVIKG